MSSEFLYYVIEDIDLSAADVVDKIADGLTDMNAGTGEVRFDGKIALLLAVPVEVAEMVEEAARRNGVMLARKVEDE